MPLVGHPGKESGIMPKRHLEQPTQEARAKQRKTLGPLRGLTVQPVAKERYQKSLDEFFQYLSQEQLILPHNPARLDLVVSDYLEYLWAKGYGRASASNILAALQDRQPQVRGKMPQAWRLLKAWVTHEVPNRAPPIPIDFLEALVGYALFKEDFGFAVTLLLGFHGMLRTGELLQLRASHIAISSAKGPAVISLGWTKAGKRHGAAESVTLHMEDVCRRLFQWKRSMPAQQLIAGPSHVWRNKFNQALHALSFDRWDFRPYSLRRGGATYQFNLHGQFDRLLIQGRWQSVKTARIYVNDGLAVLAELTIPWSSFSRNLRTQFHVSLTKPLPKLSPVASRGQTSRKAQKRGTWKKGAPKKLHGECGGSVSSFCFWFG